MIRQSLNEVVIEGILSEKNLSLTSFNDSSTGEKKDAIRGDITVRVIQEIEGEEVTLDIPVNFFATKLTKKGKPSPAYSSIKDALDNYSSIAEVGIDAASRIRVTGAKVQMNEYYTPDLKFINYPRIQASFINRIKAEDCHMRAIWEMELFIKEMGFQIDKEGVETATFEIKGINVDYGEMANVIPVITNRANIASALQATYQPGDTVPMSGWLNFTSEQKVIFEEVEIGDPIEKIRTTHVSELVISAAKAAKDEGAYTNEDMKSVLAKREVKLAAQKEKATSQAPLATERKAPAAGQQKIDLGF